MLFPPLTAWQKKELWVAKMLRTRRINKSWRLSFYHYKWLPFYTTQLSLVAKIIGLVGKAKRWVWKWEIHCIDGERYSVRGDDEC